MSTLSNLELIRRVPLFAFLTPSQADVVAQAVVKRRFRRGALVMRQGERSNTLFIILTGRVRVVAADQRGREVTLAIRQAGHHIGEMSLIDKEPHSATVRAEVQTDMLALGGAEFTHCLQASPSMAYALLRGLVQAASGPQDRVVRVHGCLRTSCPCPAGVSRHRQSGRVPPAARIRRRLVGPDAADVPNDLATAGPDLARRAAFDAWCV